MKHKMVMLPQFSDSDILGHANFQATVRWFEAGRMPIYRLFAPNADVREHKGIYLVMAHMDIDYLHETNLDDEVVVHTWVSKIGNSSFWIEQETEQRGTRCSAGKFVLVCYDVAARKSAPIPEPIRRQLADWQENG